MFAYHEIAKSNNATSFGEAHKYSTSWAISAVGFIEVGIRTTDDPQQKRSAAETIYFRWLGRRCDYDLLYLWLQDRAIHGLAKIGSILRRVGRVGANVLRVEGALQWGAATNVRPWFCREETRTDMWKSVIVNGLGAGGAWPARRWRSSGLKQDVSI